MMKPATRNIKVGTLVLAALLTLIAALYFIGSKQNLFGNTFRIGAYFYNVNGLTQGNNVRFAGIDVGTVASVEVVNDSSVFVVLVIEDRIRPFIGRNALAAIGTDGLMGNKLVNISPGQGGAPAIEEGQFLKTLRPVEMDVMVRTLDMTNQNLEVITSNLRHITDKINSRNSLWTLLMDTVIASNVKVSFDNIRYMSVGGLHVIHNLQSVTDKVNKGEGSLGAFLTDTLLAFRFKAAVGSLKDMSDTASQVSRDLAGVIRDVKNGKGSAGKLLKDTMLAHHLDQDLLTIKTSADYFNENMIALRHSWPFKRYFKNQAKSRP